MRLHDFASSKLVTQLGISLAQHSPRQVGTGLARAAAAIIARRKPEI